MRRLVDDERLMLQICELYYNQGLTQKEISQSLNLSRPTVSKILMNAKESGMVRVIITDLSGRNNILLERKLEKKFAIRAAIITDTFEDEEQQKSELGAAAAKFLERVLEDGDTIGISMGSTLSYIAPHIAADYFHNIRVTPMVGGVGATDIELHSNNLAEAVAKALGGQSLHLHAPAMVSRIQAKNELMREKSIAATLDIASNLDVALCGIGAPHETSTIIQTGYFSREMIEDFQKYNICGDICMNFFDKNGNVSAYEHNQRVIGVNVETLRKTPWSIGIAGGKLKADAIRGALAGKYINALIVDYECAIILLED